MISAPPERARRGKRAHLSSNASARVARVAANPLRSRVAALHAFHSSPFHAWVDLLLCSGSCGVRLRQLPT